MSCNKLEVVFAPPQLGIDISPPVVKEYIGAIPYEGEYEVTPSEETQVLFTDGKVLARNVIVHPIPSNWGKITWNGAVLTVT